MKSLMTLCALLLPAVVLAEQGSTKPPTSVVVSQPYRVVAIQEPLAFAPSELDFQGDEAKPNTVNQAKDDAKPADTQKSNNGEVKIATKPANGSNNYKVLFTDGKDGKVSYVLPADGNTVFPFYTEAEPAGGLRVDLDLRNASLKDAVKQLSDQTKQQFAVDADVPNEPRITIVAKHIRLSTALDMLTQATDVHWARAIQKKADGKGTELTYRIGKKVVSTNNLQWFDYSGVQGLFDGDPNKWNLNGNNFRLNYQELLDKNGKPKGYSTFPNLNGTLKVDPKSNNYQLLQPLIQGNKTLNYTFPKGQNTFTLGNRLVTTNTLSETRSTFTCPHCKQQVTVIHQHQAPKCEKCGRTFQDSWDFCPFDGAKRPTTANTDWQFCPVCGKKITEAIKGSGKTDGRSENKSESKSAAAVENESKGDANFFTRPGDKTAK